MMGSPVHQETAANAFLRAPSGADVVALLKLAPKTFLVKDGLDTPAGEAEWVDHLEGLARGSARERFAFDELLALGLFFAARTRASQMRSHFLIAELHLRPNVLFDAIYLARDDAASRTRQEGGARGGSRRGRSNEKLKTFVLDSARAGGYANPAAAGTAIAKRFCDESTPVPELKLEDFGATLSLARLKKTFEDWIRKDWATAKTISRNRV
jgi:hypothetical protein